MIQRPQWKTTMRSRERLQTWGVVVVGDGLHLPLPHARRACTARMHRPPQDAYPLSAMLEKRKKLKVKSESSSS